jgi:hypothetical protein
VLRATADAQAAENGDATDEVPTMSFKSLRYIKGVLYRMIKTLGASPGQAAPALTFCIPANSSSTDDEGAQWSITIDRKEGNYVVAGAAANGLAYLPVKQGSAFELHRLQHFTSPAPEPSISLVVDVCGTSLGDATTYTEDAFESVAFAAAAAPALAVSLVAEGPPLTKRFGFLNQKKDPEQVERETHELFHGKLELIEELALIKQLEQPAAEKAKEANKKAKQCDHGRRPSRCKDCGTSRCKHGRQKNNCKDCGTGHCQHGRQKHP